VGKQTKTDIAKAMGVSRGVLYSKPKLPDKDWLLKADIERVLREYPSYGYKRIALELGINKKRSLRVMQKFGIKPYRRSGKRWKSPKKKVEIEYPNLLFEEQPSCPNHIWATDFTYIWFENQWFYVCTFMDLYTREIVGFSILNNHTTQLIINAFFSSINKHPIPHIIHSDNGVEYNSKDFRSILSNLEIRISRSKPGCPWENGHQESFYGKFKTDLGDPARFNSLGELVYEIYRTIHVYNETRIHTALKMSPRQFKINYELMRTS